MIDEITIRLADYIAVGIIAVGMTLVTSLLFLIVNRLERLLDRYRLKYGFDRDIEVKEMGKDNQEYKLNKRESLFKRRVYKD